MGNEQPENDVELQRQVDELRERMAVSRADIDALQARADDANHRADDANHRADAGEARADDTQRRIEMLEARADIDQKMIAALQADGILSRENAAHLEEALRSSRRIGAAIGIVMVSRKVTEADAFAILSKASQQANRKLRLLADEVATTGDVSELPSA